MRSFKIVSFLLFVILLLSACSDEPTITVTSVPITTPEPSVLPIEIPKPSAVVSDSPQPVSAGLFRRPYSGYTLPQSISVISEADKKTFNPDKTSDYLTTSLDSNHEYTIKSIELKGGKLYLTISDSVLFESADIAYCYLKEAFSLSDDLILSLPEFNGCYFQGENLWSDEGMFYLKERILGSIQVADNAEIILPNEFDADEVTVQDFLEKFLNGKNVNKNISADMVSFEYSGEQITAIYSAEDVGADGDEEGDYEE